MPKHYVKCCVKLLLLSTTAMAGAASGAMAGTTIPMPLQAQTIDSNGVDLLNGISRPSMPQLSIGAGDNVLARSFQFNYDDHRDNFFGKMYKSTFSYEDRSVDVGYPYGAPACAYSATASADGTLCARTDISSSYSNPLPLPPASDANAYVNAGLYTLLDSDGTVATYAAKYRVVYADGYQPQAYITKVVKPSGEILNYYYVNSAVAEPHLSAVTSNYGYMLKYEYYTRDSAHPYYGDITVKNVTAINLAVDYCDPYADHCTGTQPWESWSFDAAYSNFPTQVPDDVIQSDYQTVTPPLMGTFTLSFDKFQYPSGRTILRNPVGAGYFQTVTTQIVYYDEWCDEVWVYDGPGDTSGHQEDICSYIPVYDTVANDTCTAFDTKFCADGPFAVKNGAGTWNYNFSSKYAGSPGANPHATMTITDPAGKTRTVVSDGYYSNSGDPTVYNVTRRITASTDKNGKTTTYEYAQPYALLTKITYPEGNKTQMVYDSRNNLTERRDIAKPGSGLADRVWTAAYPSTCASSITCNKPLRIRDANGNLPANIGNAAMQTDFTYDPVHGGVLTETGPAVLDPVNGQLVRPRTRYTYTAMYAQVKNASGAMVNAEGPIYKLTKVSSCRTVTTANPDTCVGTANETIVEYAYNSSNLLKTSETVHPGGAAIHLDQPYSATNLWAKTTYTYDNVGNVTVIDGPREDVDDKSYKTYDVLRRPVFEISVDPDGPATGSCPGGTGCLKRSVIKHYYDTAGREYRTEQGIGNATDGSDFTYTSYTLTTFDSVTDLPVKTVTATKP